MAGVTPQAYSSLDVFHHDENADTGIKEAQASETASSALKDQHEQALNRHYKGPKPINLGQNLRIQDQDEYNPIEEDFN
jgi:hypothetical protein